MAMEVHNPAMRGISNSNSVNNTAYSRKTLEGNWFEERFAIDQPERDFPDLRQKRPVDPSILMKTALQTSRPLPRMLRRPPHISWAVSDFGYRCKDTTYKEDFKVPRAHKDFAVKPYQKPTFVSPETVTDVCHPDRRPVTGPATGFRAVVERHEKDHDARTDDAMWGRRGDRTRMPRTGLASEMPVETRNPETLNWLERDSMKKSILSGAGGAAVSSVYVPHVDNEMSLPLSGLKYRWDDHAGCEHPAGLREGRHLGGYHPMAPEMMSIRPGLSFQQATAMELFRQAAETAGPN
uniref:Uncharacterized protein n=1 Tax=Chromera velia CCMP2878 TaxID=1169474 RepID=A0A0G4IF45_9ALVE|eukprot:Cvel_13809.t1-p1 / transcript=Cvel_13809.t1 / gene=Cvel_13809 / organism=Chromera_velia_CCMP2878 / gene_product=hypothetical protein / transcript_product=hypothetical protein / location=Cvel_scaffold958:20541-26361(-) / protein_length=293 / sequence_SO=supercontig / SO=protein_coding / is_pseudo=false